MAAATSSGLAMRFIGISVSISLNNSSTDFPVLFALFSSKCCNRCVWVAPGSTLFTVMLYCPNSFANVLAQLATAPLMVFETPNPFRGIFTEVEIIFIILP